MKTSPWVPFGEGYRGLILPFLAPFPFEWAIYLYKLSLIRSFCPGVGRLGLLTGKVIYIQTLFTCFMGHSIVPTLTCVWDAG